MITLEEFQQIIKFKNDDECASWFEPLNDILDKYEICTSKRIAAFLAQCGHESANFTKLSENLNYSAEGLIKTFPKHFPTLESAYSYAHNPVAIANAVYANRMGNGDESSGDGWTYRGRGLIQLTGRLNYAKFAGAMQMNTTEATAYLNSKAGALESAAWFFYTNNLNAYADKDDIAGMTKRINGGLIGLDDRVERYNNALAVLS